MRRLVCSTLLFMVVGVSPAMADWRWSAPKLEKPKIHLYDCKTSVCKKKAKTVAALQLKLKVAQYDYTKEREWDRWVKRYVPNCSWYGESGYGAEYSPVRYTMPNSTGSGAYGKFQFMPGTYFSFAVYRDWSPLDQEIAARHLYWDQGTAPWANC
jgi:hypothetical protein